MIRFTIVMIGMLSCLSGLYAQSEDAFYATMQARGDAFTPEWQHAQHTLKSLRGTSAAAATTPNAQRAFIAAYAPFLGIQGHEKDITIIHQSESLGLQDIFFHQTYKGLPVFPGEIDLHTNKTGRIFLVQSTLVPVAKLQELSLTPVLDAKTLETRYHGTDTQLGISQTAEGNAVLVYRMMAGSEQLDINTTTGAIVARHVVAIMD